MQLHEKRYMKRAGEAGIALRAERFERLFVRGISTSLNYLLIQSSHLEH